MYIHTLSAHCTATKHRSTYDTSTKGISSCTGYIKVTNKILCYCTLSKAAAYGGGAHPFPNQPTFFSIVNIIQAKTLDLKNRVTIPIF